MNRLILLLFLIGVGVYVYIVIYRNNDMFKDQDSEQENTQKKVHFSEKNEEFIIPNNEDIREQQRQQQREQQRQQQLQQHQILQNKENLELKLQPIDKIDLSTETLYDDIFIVNPIEIKNTNLTLSENEYFNNM
jgi:uncharacterized protein HemX